MDRGDLESGDRVYEGQSWVQALLRGTDGRAVEGHGSKKLRERLHPDRSRAHARVTPEVETVPANLCQFDERSIPPRRAGVVHSEGLPNHGERELASLPDSHKTFGAPS